MDQIYLVIKFILVSDYYEIEQNIMKNCYTTKQRILWPTLTPPNTSAINTKISCCPPLPHSGAPMSGGVRGSGHVTQGEDVQYL